ncbi:MAG TPA: HRDC domain-containing protein, partial [Thermoanaerobaculia bacterium]
RREKAARSSEGRAARSGRRAPVQDTLAGPAAAPELVSPELLATLKTWRAAESKRRRVPAFRILSDRTLTALAAARPHDEEGLLAIPGIGPRIVEKHGEALLRLLGGGEG